MCDNLLWRSARQIWISAREVSACCYERRSEKVERSFRCGVQKISGDFKVLFLFWARLEMVPTCALVCKQEVYHYAGIVQIVLLQSSVRERWEGTKRIETHDGGRSKFIRSGGPSRCHLAIRHVLQVYSNHCLLGMLELQIHPCKPLEILVSS